MNLSIGKLARILKKNKSTSLHRIYDYDDRLHLGNLTLDICGTIVCIDVRNFTFDRNRYKLRIHGVNYTHFAGYFSIELNCKKQIKLVNFSSKY